MPVRMPAALRRPDLLLPALLVVAFTVYAGSLLPGIRHPGQEFGWADNVLSNVVQVGAALLCLASGCQRRSNAWIFAGIGLTAWSVGDVYWLLALSHRDPVPYPSTRSTSPCTRWRT